MTIIHKLWDILIFLNKIITNLYINATYRHSCREKFSKSSAALGSLIPQLGRNYYYHEFCHHYYSQASCFVDTDCETQWIKTPGWKVVWVSNFSVTRFCHLWKLKCFIKKPKMTKITAENIFWDNPVREISHNIRTIQLEITKPFVTRCLITLTLS